MTSAVDAGWQASRGPLEPLRRALLWLCGFSSGYVFIEPSPHEFIMIATMALFALTGLRLRPGLMPLAILQVLACVGYAIAVVPVLTLPQTLIWTLVSCFLSITALFYAATLCEDGERRLRALLAGYLACAVILSIIAILAYAHVIPGAEKFLYLGRAQATFKDPNVFGPFLILPAMLVISRIIAQPGRALVRNGAMLLLISTAILLTFSRGAWGHFVASSAVLIFLSIVTAATNAERVRIVTLALAGALVLALGLIALLSIGQIGDFFEQRASLVQGYDAGELGRFGRHILGFLLIFDYPFGIGPLQFTKYFPEDPHNSFLVAFTSGGWIGGVAHLALVVVTLVIGFRRSFVRAPWQRVNIAVFATFVAVVGESYIIDIQHWRHFYLLIGLIWGLAVLRPATRASVASRNAPAYSPPPRSVAQPG